MNTSAHKNLTVLARMLERLERSVVPVDARQYRAVVIRVKQLMLVVPADASLDAILACFPATAELYENMHYRHSGLCRSPARLSLGAELAARAVIRQARQGEIQR